VFSIRHLSLQWIVIQFFNFFSDTFLIDFLPHTAGRPMANWFSQQFRRMEMNGHTHLCSGCTFV
jgi:hypothetical protein